MGAEVPASEIVVECPVGGCRVDANTLKKTELVDHLIELHGAKVLEMECPKITFDVECTQPADEDSYPVAVPFIIQYDGLHFVFVVYHVNDRYHFWMIFVEDGSWSDHRSFHGFLGIYSQHSDVNRRDAHLNVIHPTTASSDTLIKNARTFTMHRRGLRKYYLAANNHYTMEFVLQELIPMPPSPEPELNDEILNEEENVKEISENENIDESLTSSEDEYETPLLENLIEPTHYSFCVELCCSKCKGEMAIISTNCDVTVKTNKKCESSSSLKAISTEPY